MPYRPTERTRARLAAARERIVDAALDQLAEGGYASASVVAVARPAGVATGSVYRHFPSKGDLFAEVFRRASQREVDVLRTMTDRCEPVTHRLAAWVEAFVRRALAEPVRAYALIAEPVDPAVEAERLTFRRAYADLFERALRDGMQAGELPPLDAELTADGDRRRARRGARRPAPAPRHGSRRARRRPADLRPPIGWCPCPRSRMTS